MIKLYIDETKTLTASKKDGLKLAEIITRKTGKNPKIEELPEKGTKKADVYFMPHIVSRAVAIPLDKFIVTNINVS